MNSRQKRKYYRNCDKLEVWRNEWKPTLKSTSRERNIRRKAIKHIDSERHICCKDGARCIHFDDCIYALPF